MAIDWDLYTKRLNINGSTKRERDLNKLQNDITSKSVDSLSYKTVFINNIERHLMIDKNTKLSTKSIKTLPNEKIDLGNLVVWNDINWLVTEIDLDDEVYTKGTISLCNWLFKWQDLSGNILTRNSVVLNASQYNSGVDENKTLTLGSNQFMIYLPLDDDTLKLSYDKRVFIDNNYKIPYKITRPDNVSTSYNGNGLICLIMSQDVLSDTDRPDLGLCNYFEPVIQPSTTCEITYANSPTIYVGGNAKTFTVIFKDSDGNILTDVSAIWSTDISIADQTKILFTDKGNNTCTLKAINDMSLIGKVVRLSVTDINNIYNTYLDIQLKGVM